jgi:hypothetical protein
VQEDASSSLAMGNQFQELGSLILLSGHHPDVDVCSLNPEEEGCGK